jgi:hypothetical protein
MKKLILISLCVAFLTSCEKYSEPSSLSLSGEYIVDRITFSKVENSSTPGDTTYQPGSVYINPNDVFPIDSISVGFTKWHLDYSVISFCPTSLPSGQVIWGKQYFYKVIGHNSINDLGYIQFNVNSSSRTFKIISDGFESLTLRTTGLWPSGSSGGNQSITLYLTRVGP